MKNFRIISHINPLYTSCPQCKKAALRKSRSRSFWERTAKKLFFMRYYRCRECGWRGSKFTWTFTKDSAKSVLYLILLAIASALIIRFLLTKFV